MMCFIIDVVWGFVATLFVFARLANRYSLGPDRLAYDDWALLAAWAMTLIKVALSWASFPFGEVLVLVPMNSVEVVAIERRSYLGCPRFFWLCRRRLV